MTDHLLATRPSERNNLFRVRMEGAVGWRMGDAQEEKGANRGCKRALGPWGIELQALWFGLTAFWFGSTLAVKEMEFRGCRPSAECGYYGKAKLIQH